ncbi:MAG: hypothetical protein KAR38_08610, partial [Calditrichia bacterium]|nr:hypothetical protein [Calditrichia bacterium]
HRGTQRKDKALKSAGIICILLLFFLQPLKAQNNTIPVFHTFHKDSLKVQKDDTKLYHETLNPQKAEFKVPQLLKMKRRDAFALGLVVTTAWGAYLSRRKADFYFDKYETTGSPQKIDEYWDKTRRYDRISEVLLVVSYISTGYIMKRLLFD